MTPHNEAKSSDYHETVLMPGDPLRAKYIAENFLTSAKCVNTVRNCFGYSGFYKGKPVSIQASGMGQPSLSIYVHELYNFYGVQSIIRVGSCGGLSLDVEVGDIVVALAASTESSMSNKLVDGFFLSPTCDYQLLQNYMNVDPDAKVGGMISNDFFYKSDDSWVQQLANMSILGVDMETNLLYALSMKYNKKALSVNTVSDHLNSFYQLYDKSMSSKERETGFSEMIENVLESL